LYQFNRRQLHIFFTDNVDGEGAPASGRLPTSEESPRSRRNRILLQSDDEFFVGESVSPSKSE